MPAIIASLEHVLVCVCNVARLNLEQKSSALHEINWVLGVLLVIASLPQKLNVVVGITSPERQWDYVVYMKVVSERLIAARAFAFLELE